MEKERKFAKINKAISPIHETKEDCDRDFNNALKYCVQKKNDLNICWNSQWRKLYLFNKINGGK